MEQAGARLCLLAVTYVGYVVLKRQTRRRENIVHVVIIVPARKLSSVTRWAADFVFCVRMYVQDEWHGLFCVLLGKVCSCRSIRFDSIRFCIFFKNRAVCSLSCGKASLSRWGLRCSTPLLHRGLIRAWWPREVYEEMLRHWPCCVERDDERPLGITDSLQRRVPFLAF